MIHRSAAKERGNSKYLKWRSKKKDLMLQVAKGNDGRAWKKLREMMLLVNQNYDEVLGGRCMDEMRDEHREKDINSERPVYKL